MLPPPECACVGGTGGAGANFVASAPKRTVGTDDVLERREDEHRVTRSINI